MAQNKYYRGPRSDHFDGERFFLPGGEPTDKSFGELLRFWRSSRAAWPEHVSLAPAKPVPQVTGSALRVTVIGHASHLIQIDGCNLLIDPVWSERASPFSFAGPKRVTDPGVLFADLPRIDAVLVTHNHYDHLDLDTLARLASTSACRFIVPLGNDAILAPKVPKERIEAYDWGDTVRLSAGNSVVLLPSQHWSARGLSDRRMALWAAYLIHTATGSIYHVGDTGFGDGSLFRDVARRCGSPRLAILPIGAYEPRWFLHQQHMDPSETVMAFKLTGAHYGLAHHWGCFQLSSEARTDPPQRLGHALDEEGIRHDRFRALEPGSVFDVPPIAS